MMGLRYCSVQYSERQAGQSTNWTQAECWGGRAEGDRRLWAEVQQAGRGELILPVIQRGQRSPDWSLLIKRWDSLGGVACWHCTSWWKSTGSTEQWHYFPKRHSRISESKGQKKRTWCEPAHWRKWPQFAAELRTRCRHFWCELGVDFPIRPTYDTLSSPQNLHQGLPSTFVGLSVAIWWMACEEADTSKSGGPQLTTQPLANSFACLRSGSRCSWHALSFTSTSTSSTGSGPESTEWCSFFLLTLISTVGSSDFYGSMAWTSLSLGWPWQGKVQRLL